MNPSPAARSSRTQPPVPPARRGARLLLALLATGALGATCPAPVPPKVTCPDDVPAAPRFGTPASRAARRSIGVDLRFPYASALVRLQAGALGTLSAQCTPPDAAHPVECGIDLVKVSLGERGAGSDRVSYVTVKFVPWLRDVKANGARVPLPGREYTLEARLVPYLLTRATLPDAGNRRTLLGCGADPTCDEGILLALEYLSLARGAPLDCSTAARDDVDAKILKLVREYFANQHPTALRLDGLLEVVRSMAGAPVNAVGMDWSTQRDVKLALVLDRGTPSPFDADEPAFAESPASEDWGAFLDAAVIAPLIKTKLEAYANDPKTAPGFSGVTAPVVAFADGGARVVVAGLYGVPVCGAVPFSAGFVVGAEVCAGALLARPPSAQALRAAVTLQPRDDLQKACVDTAVWLDGAAKTLESWAKSVFGGGAATAPVAPAACAGGIPVARCPLVVPVGSLDTLYAARIAVSPAAIRLYGRSVLMNSREPARPPLPAPAPCSK